MDFRWQQVSATQWQLQPSIISVREDAPGRWNIYMDEFALVPMNYTGPEAAKRDAWAYALRHRLVYFGVYWQRNMKLVEDHTRKANNRRDD